jgi:hypothetical protein
MSKLRSFKLNKALADFTDEMRKRLAQKEQQGFTGWDREEKIPIEGLIDVASLSLTDLDSEGSDKYAKTAIDVANFMMFLWYRSTKNGADR